VDANMKKTPLDDPLDDFEDDLQSNNETGYRVMEGIWKIHQVDEDADRDLIETYFVPPGFKVTYQYDAAYITEESSRVAQLNTSGITTYGLERLNGRAQSLKHFLIVEGERLEEAQQALTVVQEDEAHNKMLEAKYKELMGQVFMLETEVHTRRTAVEKKKR
jgi:hypothetical protein